MEITSEMNSLVYKQKEDFEEKMKSSLITNNLKQVILKSIPFNKNEEKKLNDPDFKNKLVQILSPIAKEMVEQYQNVAEFKSANLFTNMINTISNSVSLESEYRTENFLNNIYLDNVSTENFHDKLNETFSILDFTSEAIGSRFIQDIKYSLTTEDTNDILENIKDEVKTAVEETEAKNELVQNTTKEIIDYKNEVAPPDDKYVDPENPEETEDDDSEDKGDDDSLEETEEETEDDDSEDKDDDSDDDSEDKDDDSDDDSDDSEDKDDDNTNTDINVEETEDDDSEDKGDDDSLEETEDDDSSNTDINVEEELSDTTKTEDGTDTDSGQSGGITINISGVDIKKAKESLNLYTAEKYADKAIPVSGRQFNDIKLPSVNDMASECVNCIGTGKVEDMMDIRFRMLGIALKQQNLSNESVDVLTKKYEKYKEISKEAIDKSNFFEKTMSILGITQNGLLDTRESTFDISRQILARFLTETKGVNPVSLPFTSKENVISNAFDIVQLKQELKNSKDPDPVKVRDLISRENVFYTNLVKFNDDEVKNKAVAILDLSDMIFKKAMSANFITDYKIKVWEQNVGKNANKNANEVVVKRVVDKMKKLWCRDLNDEEMQIIEATTSGDDVTDIVPNPYEKFIITLSKESLKDKSLENSSAISFTKNEKLDIKFKAKLLTTIMKACEKFDIINEDDTNSFESFNSVFKLNDYV